MTKLPKPLGLNVLVRLERSPAEPEIQNGIVIPDNPYRTQRGVVVTVGSGLVTDHGVRVPLEVEEGHVVLLASFGERLRLDGNDYVIVSENMIIGTFGPA